MRLDGLRLQLLGLFVLPVTLIVLAVAVFAVGIHRRAMRALVAERDERAAAAAAAAVEEAIHARLALIEVVAAEAAAAESASPDLERQATYAQAFPLGLWIYDQTGTLVAGADRQTVIGSGQDLRLAVGSAQVAAIEVAGQKGVLFAGQQEGFTALGAIRVGELAGAALQSQSGTPGEGSAYIVGPSNQLLLAIGGPAPANLPDHAGVQAALRGELGSSFLPMADGEHVVAFAPIPSAGWGLVVEEPWETVSSSLLDLSLLAPFSLVPILILTMVGLWFGARRVIEPLRRLEEAAANLPNDQSGAIEEATGGIAEIEQLRASLARMSRRVREAQAALRAYIGVITNAQEEERRRVARELHDESIQHWIALDQQLQMTGSRLRQQGLPEAEVLDELHQQAQDGIRELRRLSRGLRPIYLEDLGLVPAIEMLARDAEASIGAPIQFELVGDPTRLAPEVELAIYRVVQEGLSNAGRHARASSIQVTLRFLSDRLEVAIEDDGEGFKPPDQLEELAAGGHYGVMGMKERADALGGEFDLDAKPGSGTRILVSVPTPPGQ